MFAAALPQMCWHTLPRAFEKRLLFDYEGVFGDFITIDDSISEVSRNLKVILGKLDNT